ncbi:ComF family protein [Candidatus Saccharibacteria bacterium CPR2]|nr:ComF family protein [Candidatus Saccharibacteria bacterium CPR2]
MIEDVLKLIAPHSCVSCRQLGNLLCDGCRESYVVHLPSRCFLCKKITLDHRSCDNCYAKTKLKHVWVGAEYEEPISTLIQKFKYNNAKDAYKIFANFLADVLPHGLPSNMLVTHVPTANNRIRVRGYDQCELLARKLAKQRGWQYSRLLLRVTNARQVGSSKHARLHQMDGAFWAINQNEIAGKEILIIDDVVTTGATLSACAKTLKNAGAKTVSAIAIAQTCE